MAITYIRPDTGEAVDKEAWTWRANYADGSTLEQFEVSAKGAVFHSSQEIQTDGLVSLQLLHNTYPSITVAYVPGATPVHFYRNRQEVEEFTDQQTGEVMHRTWQYKLWVIGIRIDGQYWLAYTDAENHTIFSSDDKLFTHNGKLGL